MSEVEKAIACANWLNEHRQFVACYAVGNNESGGEWEVERRAHEPGHFDALTPVVSIVLRSAKREDLRQILDGTGVQEL